MKEYLKIVLSVHAQPIISKRMVVIGTTAFFENIPLDSFPFKDTKKAFCFYSANCLISYFHSSLFTKEGFIIFKFETALKEFFDHLGFKYDNLILRECIKTHFKDNKDFKKICNGETDMSDPTYFAYEYRLDSKISSFAIVK